jgi:putative DNA primase/helicase
LLEGEGSNGKSVVVNVMAGLLGQEAVSSIPLSSFAARFDKFFTFGKALNVCSEASELTPRLEDHLKAYVGGDLISTDRKHREVFQFRPTAKLVVTTNNRPRVADESMGFWRRMLLLPFRVSISPSEQNPRLADELLETEGEGILVWALEGLRRLRRNNQFTIPKLSQEEQAAYRRESSPVMQFVEERLTQGEATTVECGEVYKAYSRWAQQKGEKPLSDAMFGKSLRRAVSGLDTVQHRKDGVRVRSYVGIAFVDSRDAANRDAAA